MSNTNLTHVTAAQAAWEFCSSRFEKGEKSGHFRVDLSDCESRGLSTSISKGLGRALSDGKPRKATVGIYSYVFTTTGMLKEKVAEEVMDITGKFNARKELINISFQKPARENNLQNLANTFMGGNNSRR